MNWKKALVGWAKRLFQAFPDGFVKNSLRCWVANRKAVGYQTHYRKGRFEVVFPNFSLKFTVNPLSPLSTNRLFWVYRKPQPGDVVVDAGAHFGAFTLVSSRLVGPTGKVIAFEPDPALFRMLQKHIELNQIVNVIAINSGLWDGEGHLPFYRSETTSLAHTFLPNSQLRPPMGEIPVCSLDTALSQLGISRVDFVKMNIEGAEILALGGAKHLLRGQPKPHWAVSSDHLVDGQLTRHRVEDIFHSFGYSVKTVKEESTLSESSYLTTFAWPAAEA